LRRIGAFPAAILPLLLRAQADPDGLLRQARTRIAEDLAKLPKYTCVQSIQRARYELFYGTRPKRCGEVAKSRGAREQARLLLVWTDRFKLDVTVSEGTEIFSWAGARQFQSEDVQDIIGGGLTGSGDFGPFLMDIFGTPSPEYRYAGLDRSSGDPVAVYQYRIAATASHYQIKTGPRAGDTAILAFEGSFSIDAQTGVLRRLTIIVPDPPARSETCRIETEIDYKPVAIAGTPVVLPQSTLLKLWDPDGSRYENRIEYAGCRAFQSESVFRPEVEGAAADTASASSAPRAATQLPAGLTLHIALRTPIDMQTAAGGDPVEGRLEEEIRGPTGLIASRGATVHGRVVRAERHFVPGSFFALGLRFESVVAGGAEIPLALEPVPHSTEARTLTEPLKGQGIGMFVFHGDPRTIEDLESEWRTTGRLTP